MKIRIEIQTNEPSPDIASLVSEVVKLAVKNRSNDNDDVRLADEISVDETLLTKLEDGHARLEVSNVSEGSLKYAQEDLGIEYSLTFSLETWPAA